MAFSDLWPSWMGGTGIFGSPSTVATDTALQNMGQGVYGPETAADYTAAGGPAVSSGSGIAGGDIAKALNQLKSGLDQQQQQNSANQQRGVQAGSATSGTGQGSPAGINALIQLLLQRANQYFPGQPNPKPVALARPSGGGLLGL